MSHSGEALLCFLGAGSLSHIRLCNPMDYSLPARPLCPWNFPGKITGAGCHFLLQGIFPIQELNLPLLHWQADSFPLSHLGSDMPSTPPSIILPS